MLYSLLCIALLLSPNVLQECRIYLAQSIDSGDTDMSRGGGVEELGKGRGTERSGIRG